MYTGEIIESCFTLCGLFGKKTSNDENVINDITVSMNESRSKAMQTMQHYKFGNQRMH